MAERLESTTLPPRQSRRTLALLLIGAGIMIWLSSSGLFSSAAWSVLWPLALIGVGLDLVTQGRQRRRIIVGSLIAALICVPIANAAYWFGQERVEAPRDNAQQAVPQLGDIERLRATVSLPMGKLQIRDWSGSDDEVVDLGSGIVVTSYAKEGDTGILDLGRDGWDQERFNLRFARDLPLDLSVDVGAGDASPLDFNELKLERLKLTLHGGNAEVRLPEEGVIEVDVTSTAGNVDIDVPDDLAARIEVASSWSDLDLDERFQQQSGAYVSEDFSSDAPNRVVIRIEATAGNVTIR